MPDHDMQMNAGLIFFSHKERPMARWLSMLNRIAVAITGAIVKMPVW